MKRLREQVALKPDPVSSRGGNPNSQSVRKSEISRGFSRAEMLLELQRTHGNAFVQRLVQRELAGSQLDGKSKPETVLGAAQVSRFLKPQTSPRQEQKSAAQAVEEIDAVDAKPIEPSGTKHDLARRTHGPVNLTRRKLFQASSHFQRKANVPGAGAASQVGAPLCAQVQLQGTSTTPAQTAENPNTPVLDPYKGASINKAGHVSAPANQIRIAKTVGVNVRPRPDGTLPHIAKVLYDAEVQVPALDTTGAFYFIIAKTGAVGWINKDFVALDPPDAASHLHHITESNLTTILKNEYVDKNLWTLSTGNDYTTLAAAVVVANEGRKGVSVDWAKVKKYKEDNPLKRWLDPWMIDNFAIYHGSKILSGHNIWLPSPNYVRMLQNSGVIGSRPDWINVAVDIGKTIVGFNAGIIAGIFGTLWDTLTGLWELAEGIVNAIKGALDGSLFAAIEEIYNKITSMTWQDMKNMVDELITMGKNAFNDFEKKWNHPDMYQQWHFKGYILGAVALEVVLAIFSGGAALGAKVLAKIGKYFPRLMRILDKLLELADKLPGRRKGDHDRPKKDKDRDRDREDKDRSEEDRGWEQALALATLVTEEHDLKDTPVEMLIPLLNNTIAVKFSEVTSYKATPLSTPHTYEILQTARGRRVVDADYTEKKKTPKVRPFFDHLVGKSAKQVKERARQAGWKPTKGLRTGQGWYFTDENGIERFRYRESKHGKFHHEQTGYVRWTDEGGILLDINGRQVVAGGTPVHWEMSQARIRGLCADDAEFDRIMGATHISVDHLGGDW